MTRYKDIEDHIRSFESTSSGSDQRPGAVAWGSAPITTGGEPLYLDPAEEDVGYRRPPKIFIGAREALRV